MNTHNGLPSSKILAAASQFLEKAGYRRVDEEKLIDWKVSSARAFEDAYSIAAVVVYDTWEQLRTNWPDTQADLVELISKYVRQGEPKAWEGYLVLMTPASPTVRENDEVARIRYDTTRVRKLLATGEELRQLEDVRRTLLPLLPIAVDVPDSAGQSALELLPSLLASSGVPKPAARTIVDAFLNQQPLLESLHRFRSKQQ